MREIKFRGYDDNRRRWCCGMLFTVFCKYARILQPDGDYYSVEPDSVGQYTGFDDALGAKIFEGDIISFPDWVTDEFGDFMPVKNIARVVFNTVSGAWEIEDPLHRRGSISPMLSLLPRDGLKVIGNMFENAEILKGEVK